MDAWDRKPKEPASQFLRLKNKDEQVRVRIVAAPLRELRVYPAGGTKQPPLKSDLLTGLTKGQWVSLMRNPEYDVSEVFHLLVIDRADQQAKVFTTTGGVYGKIRDYAKDPEWGNPTGYDITIRRTEKPGPGYYEVTPSPNKSDVTAGELDKVDKLDIAKMLPNALPANEEQPDDNVEDVKPEPLPWEGDQPASAAADTPSNHSALKKGVASVKDKQAAKAAEEDEDDDKPIDLSEIPF